ncbi:MAG: hypothetical protein EA425_02565 [Puniceicoccaceae bacterium]|nr:MAG: hypothetical protein EA425_02565 [Puniceicoccaceae bacterium]
MPKDVIPTYQIQLQTIMFFGYLVRPSMPPTPPLSSLPESSPQVTPPRRQALHVFPRPTLKAQVSRERIARYFKQRPAIRR